jgi:hypothetical protein
VIDIGVREGVTATINQLTTIIDVHPGADLLRIHISDPSASNTREDAHTNLGCLVTPPIAGLTTTIHVYPGSAPCDSAASDNAQRAVERSVAGDPASRSNGVEEKKEEKHVLLKDLQIWQVAYITAGLLTIAAASVSISDAEYKIAREATGRIVHTAESLKQSLRDRSQPDLNPVQAAYLDKMYAILCVVGVIGLLSHPRDIENAANAFGQYAAAVIFMENLTANERFEGNKNIVNWFLAYHNSKGCQRSDAVAMECNVAVRGTNVAYLSPS